MRLLERPEAFEKLVHAVARGDPAAASTLHGHYSAHVNRLVWRLLGADAEHDDVVQQTFVNIICSMHTLREPERLDAWITSVTVNTVRREIRSRRFRRRVATEADPAEAVASGSDPERAVAVRRFYEVVARLREDARIVFILSTVEGYTLAEIATATDSSLATVKRRLRRARSGFMKRARQDPVLASWMEQLSHDG